MIRFVFEKYCSTSIEEGGLYVLRSLGGYYTGPGRRQIVRPWLKALENGWWLQVIPAMKSVWLGDWLGACRWEEAHPGRLEAGHGVSPCWAPNHLLGSLGWIEQLFWKYTRVYLWLAAEWKGSENCPWDCFILFLRITAFCHVISFYRICRFFCALSICIFIAALLGREKTGYFKNKNSNQKYSLLRLLWN